MPKAPVRALEDKVSTVVLLMLENRSFDHLLGHLSLEGLAPAVKGLVEPFTEYTNYYAGRPYAPFKIQRDRLLDSDLPHETAAIAAQLARSSVTGRYTMRGFVESYANYRSRGDVGNEPDPMGYMPSDLAPVTSFLARSFCVCDSWHAPLPSSTQPNRCMAFCGESRIATTKARLLTDQPTLLDWLSDHEVPWRVYHDGLSFFALYTSAWKYVLDDDRFRDFERYADDMEKGDVPQVVILEPSYQDAPHVGSDRPNDNHPPLALGWGEEFLRRAYEGARASPTWKKTVMVLYYDEHGGFFDHVPPLDIPYTTLGDPAFRFESTGPRVPAVIISPLVEPGSVSHAALDHTSVLQFLAERFTKGKPYSPSVEARRRQGIESISPLLRDESFGEGPIVPYRPIAVETVLGRSLAEPPSSAGKAAFEAAAMALMRDEPKATAKKYPELTQWRIAVESARGG